jgi:hypothetical protein
MFGKTDLERAARAVALCLLVRSSEWQPQDGDILHNAIIGSPSPIIKPKNHNIGEGLLATSTQGDPIVHPGTPESAQRIARVATYNPPWLHIEEETPLHNSSAVSRLQTHGYHNIPSGYHFEIVPRRATLIDLYLYSGNAGTGRISYNYSLVKILVSLGQAIYAIFTLYRARGDQIVQFGYAEFGLTVAPYAVVSVLNLLGSLLCPEFP